MLRGAVARRYAQALYEIGEANNSLVALEKELKGVAETVEGSRDLQKVLYHPQILPAKKKRILKAIFGAEYSAEAMKFLGLLVEKRRESYFVGIVAEFIALVNKARNTAAASITSAAELAEEQKQELLKVLTKLSGKEVSPTFEVDPSLIGGVVVRVGDKVIDGSIKTRLATLKSRLMSKTS